jgi:hypothetical protein
MDKTLPLFCCLLHADFLLDLFFHPEDVGDIFLRNVGLIFNGLHAVIPYIIELFITTLHEPQILQTPCNRAGTEEAHI